MPTIAYTDFGDYLNQADVDAWPAVTLVCGEEMLCRKAVDGLLDRLVPAAEREMGVEVFDGAEARIADVLTSLNTYALLTRRKVVMLGDARLFYSAKAQQGLREKMTAAATAGEMKKASRPFLNLMALLGLTFEDLTTAGVRKKVADDAEGEPAAWLTELIAYCREQGLRIPEKRDEAESLHGAMQKGFPEGHRLVISTDIVDRRKALFKAIDDTGVVVDCTVPKGETRADRTARDQVAQSAMTETLTRAGKKINADARRRLLEWTGFDLRTLTGNLEKLISFVGERRTIADADVTAVLRRTRKDPIFEFTNAVGDRDLSGSLFYLQNLLADGMHPLQLLAALTNQVRRLLVAKDFIVRDRARAWQPRMNFAQFKGAAFKAVQDDDTALNRHVQSWDEMLKPAAGGKKRKAAASDLVLAKNPRSPFPAFQTLKKADAFSLEALRSAMIELSATDLKMKSTGQDPRLLLEAFLVRFCG